MALGFDDLKSLAPKTKALPIDVDGFDEQVLVYQFKWVQFDKLLALEDDETGQSFKKQVICLLKGPACFDADGEITAITKEECDWLSAMFSVSQAREIYQKGLRLNGFGPDAARDAEKN